MTDVVQPALAHHGFTGEGVLSRLRAHLEDHR